MNLALHVGLVAIWWLAGRAFDAPAAVFLTGLIASAALFVGARFREVAWTTTI
jgi:hypothetical protein